MYDLMRSVLGAGSRIELHLFLGAGKTADELETWREVEALADQRLNRRLVLSYVGAPTIDLRDLTATFLQTGWEVRVYPEAIDRRPIEFLIVDREVAYAGGGSESSRQLNRVITDARTVDALVSDFRGLWSTSVAHTDELLYRDDRQEGPGQDESSFWNELIGSLARHPEHLYSLDPRRFEELVAELLSRQGYEASLTPISRDGGRDIVLVSPNTLGRFVLLVECKRYAPDKPVSVALARSLYGAVEAERATAGILVTTSRFTEPARGFERAVSSRLALKDYENLKEWLRACQRRNTAG